ncbi:hypothetical protein ME763_28085 [Streptomyces murinus]|nr:hypothetical protein [Streptomyces murinus]WDO11200.1 hypothetical protein ME763_28085 [Streptomyces murinus]
MPGEFGAGPLGHGRGQIKALTRCSFSTERLSGDAVLWGKEVTDERYAVVAGV